MQLIFYSCCSDTVQLLNAIEFGVFDMVRKSNIKLKMIDLNQTLNYCSVRKIK